MKTPLAYPKKAPPPLHPRPPHQTPPPQHLPHPRRLLRKGRRRQIHHRRQPLPRLFPARPPHRPPRHRPLRPLHPHSLLPQLPPVLTPNNQLTPLTNYGVKTMSIGYLLPATSSPLVWRGPMLLKAIQQLLHDVDWSPGLDVLVLDLPPGTGDIQLSITQQIPLDGAVIVTTPHTLAVKDAVKGVEMFGKVGVEVLGLVKNMSLFTCPCCNTQTSVFGSGEEIQKMCEEYGMEVLGDVPLHPNIGEDGSRGKPTVVAEPDSERARVFMEMAKRLGEKIGLVAD
ncbi:ParA/MinD ATPase like-domain-containing protein [Apiosordaria backusii]|uniref:ParA/MinD ATPase like-domain-containing protein n=1 Tax=Apiosordaria backusii TaxID=314023 RepID=A0AA39ZUX2_9PEZI|nr:ParA/MinD ATPase like-domain-containing protein [Apiosordaria backusii]